MLQGIGSETSLPVKVADALAAAPGERFDAVLDGIAGALISTHSICP